MYRSGGPGFCRNLSQPSEKRPLTSEGICWPDATLSLKSGHSTELTGFEAEWGLLRSPAGSLASVTWAPVGSVRRLESPCSKPRDTDPDYSGHRSTFLYAVRALISDNYLLEKRSRVLSAPSRKLKDRRKLLTMGQGRCTSAPKLKTRYCLTDE
jgi:hypothetical protein